MTWCRTSLVALIVFAFCCGTAANAASAQPRITAQGFSIDTALRAEAGRFDPIRVRIEAPSRIAKLLITDGDMEIDLASTPDRTLFALFGLDQRPMNAFDITLDFAPYINGRLLKAASYRIGITVVDRDGAVAQDAMTVTVIATGSTASDENTALRPLDETRLKLERHGAGHVEPVATSPLTWVTHEAINVTIRLRPSSPDATLHELPASSWDSILTHESLDRQLARTSSQPYIDVQTARNGAAGTIIALRRQDSDALIRLTGSATNLSAVGTTVILTAIVRD